MDLFFYCTCALIILASGIIVFSRIQERKEIAAREAGELRADDFTIIE